MLVVLLEHVRGLVEQLHQVIVSCGNAVDDILEDDSELLDQYL